MRSLRCYHCLWLSPAWWAALLLWVEGGLPAQAQQEFRLLSYNVENLFDTVRSQTADDADFQPDGRYGWDGRRYWSKLGKLARVVAAAGGASPVDVVGLCEVENDSVVYDLVRRTSLARLGYDFIVTHSRDVRGLNVALLYQPARFRPVGSRTLAVPWRDVSSRPTRDLLAVEGRLSGGDTLAVVVCHFPSRRGGRKASEAFRLRAAGVLRGYVDSLFRVRPAAKMVIMGDFNDEYPCPAIADVLQATTPDSTAVVPDRLYVLSHRLRGPGEVEGSYKFGDRWWQLDQMVVSGSLWEALPPSSAAIECRIFAPPFLLADDGQPGTQRPHRTYRGPVYQGGVSDHLPLLLTVGR